MVEAVHDGGHNAARRVRELQALGSHTALEWAETCAKYGNKCLCCGASDRPLTRDHVIPLVLGGSDAIGNLQPLCGPCNSAKGQTGLDYRPDRNGGVDGGVLVEDQRVTGELMPAMWRATIREAAMRLGVSEGAIRKRVARGTLESEKDEDGRVYVVLPDVPTDGDTEHEHDPGGGALISRLEGEVEFLRDQVRRQQEIIAQQAVTMRQLTAAAQEEPTEDAQTVAEEPEGTDGTDTPTGRGGAETGAQRRSWWRRFFGVE